MKLCYPLFIHNHTRYFRALIDLLWEVCVDIADYPLTSSMQKEIALYTASKINSEFCWFDIDGDIDPLFKVHGIYISFAC